MKYLLVSVIAYLLGNFATAYVVAKAAGKIDIRKFGSGNAGSTNVLRVLGVKAAILVFAGDVLKGVAAVIIGRYLAGSNGALLAGILVVIGHNWPIVLGGKGGKGIATTIGVMLAIDPLIVLFIVVIGVIIIAVTRYVSLASVTGVIIFPISMIVANKPLEYIIFSLILCGMALFKHWSNIGRLMHGTESKIGLKKKP
jgi:glycerol-3-phosphate acyltransferase PlsY